MTLFLKLEVGILINPEILLKTQRLCMQVPQTPIMIYQ